MQARIAQLWRYPVKSCAGEPVQALGIDAQGWPLGDREWAVANEHGELSWMGEHARLAWVAARLLDDGALQLEDRTGQRRTFAPEAGVPAPLRIWNEARAAFDAFDGWDLGAEAAALLRGMTGAALRLVRLPQAARWRPGAQALHLVGQGSLDAWREAQAGVRQRSQRLRANLVLEALPGQALPAFIEDHLLGLHAPQARLRVTAACVRCVVPSVDTASAEVQAEVGAVLAQLSQARFPGAPVRFGVYAQGEGAGVLRVGDPVQLALHF